MPVKAVVLAAIAIAQLAFFVIVFAVLVARRVAEAGRARRRAAERAELSARVHDVLAGTLSPGVFAGTLPAYGPGLIAAVLQEAGSQVRGDAWDRLAAAVRGSPWFRRNPRRRARSAWWWRRVVAARLLALVGDEQDLETGVRLVSDRHPAVRLAAIQLLRRLPHPRLVAVVLDQAIVAPRVARQHYFDILGTAREALAPILLQRLAAPSGRWELRAMLTLAGQLAAPELLDPLLGYATSTNADDRMQVARALGRYPHQRARDVLIVLLSDPVWEVRTQAASSLGTIHALDARDGLRAAMSDENWWVRLRAAIALRQLGETGLQVLRQARGEADRFASEMAGYILGLSDEAVANYAA